MVRTSLRASLVVLLCSAAASAYAAPTNDRFANAVALNGWVATSTVDPNGAQTNQGDPNAGAYQPISLWWSYTPPSDGEVTLSVSPVPVSSDTTPQRPINGQGYEVYLYNATPAPTSPGHSNFFDDHWGGLRAGENSTRLTSLDMRFNGKANTTYYIEIGTYATFTQPFTVKAATAVGTSSWYWRSDHKGGTGYAIETRGGNVFAGFFLYNSDGTPNWYVASGPLVNGNHFAGQLLQYKGGQPITNAQSPAQAGTQQGSAGPVVIDWTSPCHANMTWPGGVVPIDCFVFDSSSGYQNTGMPDGYHTTGWYWLPEDGGGRGLFGQAQGSSEFWVIFHYDATGNATWHVASVGGLPTDPNLQPFGGMANQYQSTCAAWQNPVNPNTGQAYIYGYPFYAYSGGQTVSGPYKPATIGSTPFFYSSVNCNANFNTVSVAGFSTMNGAEYSGPSTTLGGTDLMLDGTTNASVISDPNTGNTITQSNSSAAAYQSLCADVNGECHFSRFQF